MNREAINGYGAILRFITPILITIILFLLKDIKADMLDVKRGFSNHLEHHRSLETTLGERLKCLETINEYVKQKR